MQLAVNYSNPLIDLLKKGQIELDLIKCPDWEGMVREASPYAPLTIHFDLKAGLGQTFKTDLNRLADFARRTNTPHINTHLVAPRNFSMAHEEEIEKINRLWREEILILIREFGENKVALEHFPLSSNNPHITLAANPQVFSQVIEDTDCRLLLDLAHARISAETMQMPVKEYIRALPLQRLVEVHITGIKKYSGVLTDHFEMTDEDWDLFYWLLDEIKTEKIPSPRLFAFEYGGVGEVFAFRSKRAVLAQQVPRLYEAIHTLEA